MFFCIIKHNNKKGRESMRKKIFSIALLGFLSTLSAGVISQNGIAKDSTTGLMWQDDNDAQTIRKDWNGAKAYCENLAFRN